jgi:hypothetical protein
MEIQLTDHQQRLLASGMVILADKKSGEIPEEMRPSILRGFGGNFGNKGLACTFLRDDGKVVIVIDGEVSPSLLRHEFIHAAQCFAGEDVMTDCLAAATKQGALIANVIEHVISRDPSLAHQHRDYERTVALWRSHADGSGCSAPMVDFEFYQDLYPTVATASLVSEVLNLHHPRGAYAALTARICSQVGFALEPLSDMAREIVAYTFETIESAVIDELMNEASINAEEKSFSSLASCARAYSTAI